MQVWALAWLTYFLNESPDLVYGDYRQRHFMVSGIMNINNLDHLVLTVKDLEKSIKFYTEILGMEKEVFRENRVALKYGNQKINLHEFGNELEPKARNPDPGSSDLCFITEDKIENVIDHFRKFGVKIIEGPVKRTGAIGEIKSIYIRDPDENLIEISNY